VFDTSVSLVTPLMEAISYNRIEAASFLVQSGASLAVQDIRNENALHYGARSSSRMIRAILKASKLNSSQIQALASATNIKLQFPEDVSETSIAREVLIHLREKGTFPIRKKRIIGGVGVDNVSVSK
jgi:ankyrin repeat protein